MAGMLHAEQSLGGMLGGGCRKLGQLTVGSAWISPASYA